MSKKTMGPDTRDKVDTTVQPKRHGSGTRSSKGIVFGRRQDREGINQREEIP